MNDISNREYRNEKTGNYKIIISLPMVKYIFYHVWVRYYAKQSMWTGINYDVQCMGYWLRNTALH
jgi:hypothetical protein